MPRCAYLYVMCVCVCDSVVKVCETEILRWFIGQIVSILSLGCVRVRAHEYVHTAFNRACVSHTSA